MAPKETILPDWIMAKVPQKYGDTRKKIPAACREEWIARICDLAALNDLGYERLARHRGGWPERVREPRPGAKRRQAVYDPVTHDFIYIETIEEANDDIVVYCSRRLFPRFKRAMVKLLTRMGRDLRQQSVGYKTKKGLHLIDLKK